MVNFENIFQKLYGEHPNTNLEPFWKVLEVLQKIPSAKKGMTITEIAKKLNLKRAKIARIIRVLKQYKYVKTIGRSNAIPYLSIIDKKEDITWKWGKEDITNNINENYHYLLKNLHKTKNLKKELKIKLISYQNKKKNGKFFDVYNDIVENIWANLKESNLNKLSMGSTAVKYIAGV